MTHCCQIAEEDVNSAALLGLELHVAQNQLA